MRPGAVRHEQLRGVFFAAPHSAVITDAPPEKSTGKETESMAEVQLAPLKASDREQFIRDNQEAFNYGAMEE